MDFHIVILDEFCANYPEINWGKWKDYVREQMIVQWKPVDDTLYKVSLPDHPHPFDHPL